MERKSCVEPGPVNTSVQDPPVSRLRVLLLCMLMLLPWAVISLGLYVLKDYRLTLLGYGFICCLLPVVFFRRKPIRFLPLGKKFAPLFWLVVCMNLVLLGLFYIARFGIEPSGFLPHAGQIQLALNSRAIKYGLYFVIVNPILEETFWRGFIYEEWKHWLLPKQAALLSSVFFGAWHWVIAQMFCPPLWAIWVTLLIAAGGYLLARVKEQTGTLSAPILLHSLGADIPLLFIVLMLLQAEA